MWTGLAGGPGPQSGGSNASAAVFVPTALPQLFTLLSCFPTAAAPLPKQLLILIQAVCGVEVARGCSLLNGREHSEAQRTRVVLGEEGGVLGKGVNDARQHLGSHRLPGA